MHVGLVLYLWAPYSDLVFVHRRRLRQSSFPCEISVNLVHSDKGKSLLVPETELSPIGQTEEAVSAGFLSKLVTRTIKVSELTTETDECLSTWKGLLLLQSEFPLGACNRDLKMLKPRKSGGSFSIDKRSLNPPFLQRKCLHLVTGHQSDTFSVAIW